jgi:hypothetical protein
MGTLFDKHKVLHGLPLPGQKIKYTKPSKFSWFTNVLEDEKNLLELGKEYTVRKTELNSSSTYVWLEEFWDDTIDEYTQNQKFFNMWAFEWELPELNLDDLIGLDTHQILRLKHDVGIKIDGLIEREGQPILVLEHDKNIVTKAYYENKD